MSISKLVTRSLVTGEQANLFQGNKGTGSHSSPPGLSLCLTLTAWSGICSVSSYRFLSLLTTSLLQSACIAAVYSRSRPMIFTLENHCTRTAQSSRGSCSRRVHNFLNRQYFISENIHRELLSNQFCCVAA